MTIQLDRYENKVVIKDKYGRVADSFPTYYEYEVGEIINVNSGTNCKCKEIITGVKNHTYVFVIGWTEYGF